MAEEVPMDVSVLAAVSKSEVAIAIYVSMHGQRWRTVADWENAIRKVADINALGTRREGSAIGHWVLKGRCL